MRPHAGWPTLHGEATRPPRLHPAATRDRPAPRRDRTGQTVVVRLAAPRPPAIARAEGRRPTGRLADGRIRDPTGLWGGAGATRRPRFACARCLRGAALRVSGAPAAPPAPASADGFGGRRPPSSTAIVVAGPLGAPMRAGPDSRQAVVATIPDGATVFVAEGPSIDGNAQEWYRVVYSGSTGWGVGDCLGAPPRARARAPSAPESSRPPGGPAAMGPAGRGAPEPPSGHGT